MGRTQLRGDIGLALASIAADLNVAVEELPSGIESTLRALSIAHYNAGVQDGMGRTVEGRARAASSDVTSSHDTPVVGPHGRKRFAVQHETVPLSKRPTPLIPSPRKKDLR